MRLILDTNVVISGLLWRGPSAQLIDLTIEQAVTACVNPFLSDELAEKLGMPKFASRIAAAGMTPERLCSQYLAPCGQVPALTIARTCRDPDDDNVLAAEISAAQLIPAAKIHGPTSKAIKSVTHRIASHRIDPPPDQHRALQSVLNWRLPPRQCVAQPRWCNSITLPSGSRTKIPWAPGPKRIGPPLR